MTTPARIKMIRELRRLTTTLFMKKEYTEKAANLLDKFVDGKYGLGEVLIYIFNIIYIYSLFVLFFFFVLGQRDCFSKKKLLSNQVSPDFRLF